jgi:hypothetical protein
MSSQHRQTPKLTVHERLERVSACGPVAGKVLFITICQIIHLSQCRIVCSLSLIK